MCEAVGLEVIRLKRSAEGPVKLGMLQPGEYRELKKSEISALRNAALKAAPASKAAPAAARRRHHQARLSKLNHNILCKQTAPQGAALS